MNEVLQVVESISKIVALLAAAVAVFGALFQYGMKLREEARLRDLATLEMNVKVSTLFSELVSVANGYGGWSEPQADVIKDILAALPLHIKQGLLLQDPAAAGKLLASSRIPESVPLSQQLAAAESLANLAIRYEFLKEPALVGLDVVAGFLPPAELPYKRLCTHYGIDRPLTIWEFSRAGTSRPQSDGE